MLNSSRTLNFSSDFYMTFFKSLQIFGSNLLDCFRCESNDYWLHLPKCFSVLWRDKHLLKIFYCCSIIVVPLIPPLLSSVLPPPHSVSLPPPHCPCPWVLYTCSLTWPFPIFPLLPPSPNPSGHCQFVLYFHVSGYILLACLFCWLGSTYRWDHMVFVFHHLAYFT